MIVDVARASSVAGEQLAGSALQLGNCKDEIHTHMSEFELQTAR